MEVLYGLYNSKGVVFITVVVPWKPNHGHKSVTITQFLNLYDRNSSLTYVNDSQGVVTNAYNLTEVPTLFILSKSGGVETNGRLEGEGGPIEDHAAAVIDAALAQVVVTSQTSTLSSSQTGSQNPIPGFSIESIVLGLMVGFVLLLMARRAAFKKKTTS